MSETSGNLDAGSKRLQETVVSRVLDNKNVQKALANLASSIPGLKFDSEGYISKSTTIHSKFKNILSPDTPLDVRLHYLPLPFRHLTSRKQFPLDLSFVNSKDGKVIIRGTAGSGKTTVLKWLYFQYLAESARIPILIYLKNWDAKFNKEGDFNVVLELVRQDFLINGREVGHDFTKSILRKGAALLLDGFDELPIVSQKRVLDDIGLLSKEFPYLQIILTSRPDGLLTGLQTFTIITPDDLHVNDLTTMLNKLTNEEDKVDRFISYTKEKAPEIVRDFCQTPLLGIMCYMVFTNQGMIENGFASFYNQVVFTLWLNHDQTKGFVRDRPNGCDFTSVCSVMEYLSQTLYRGSKIDTKPGKQGPYSLQTVLMSIDESIATLGLENVKSKDILHVLSSSMCILQIEGASVEFSHRSFEEYFVGKYIAGISANNEKWKSWAQVLNLREADIILHSVVQECCRLLYYKDILLPCLKVIRRHVDQGLSNELQSYRNVIESATFRKLSSEPSKTNLANDDDVFSDFLAGDSNIEDILVTFHSNGRPLKIPFYIQMSILDARIPYGNLELGLRMHFDTKFYDFVKKISPQSRLFRAMKIAAEKVREAKPRSDNFVKTVVEVLTFGISSADNVRLGAEILKCERVLATQRLIKGRSKGEF